MHDNQCLHIYPLYILLFHPDPCVGAQCTGKPIFLRVSSYGAWAFAHAWIAGVVRVDKVLVHKYISVFGFVYYLYLYLRLREFVQDVTRHSEQLRNVVLSVTHNRAALILTVGFGMIFTYIFRCAAAVGPSFCAPQAMCPRSVIAFNFLRPMYIVETDLLCDTLFLCFAELVTTGWQNYATVNYISLATAGASAYAATAVFSFTFYCIIIVLFLNVILGIIIDTFSFLREQVRGSLCGRLRAARSFLCTRLWLAAQEQSG